MRTDHNGQISAEFLLIIGIMIIVMMISVSFIASQYELTMAMTAARNGVNEGFASSAGAVYPTDSYNDYSKLDYLLLDPYSIEIVNISYEYLGHDTNYNKEKIRFNVYAHASRDFDKKELDSIGDRINYNLRKSIALTFDTSKSTNKLYNPVFSPHYVFTTANVKWV